MTIWYDMISDVMLLNNWIWIGWNITFVLVLCSKFCNISYGMDLMESFSPSLRTDAMYVRQPQALELD